MLSMEYVACFVGFSLLVQTQGATRGPPVIASGPPVITTMPDDMAYFKEGEPAQLTCKAVGRPAPTYTWLKDNQPFTGNGWTPVPLSGTLVRNYTEASDAGVYQCFANNDFGTAVSVKIHLRRARLGQFPVGNPTTLTPALGSPVVLPCVPPPSVPEAEVFWARRNLTSGSVTPVYMDVHMSQDYTGSLYITDVQIDDGTSDSAYVCIALNRVVRQNTLSAPFFIHPQEQAVADMPVYPMWTSDRAMHGLVGEEVRMKCIFSGSPTPRVEWTRVGGVIPSARSHLESYGMELIIRNVHKEDEGVYECQGSNPTSPNPVFRSISLTLSSKPQWTNKPDDVTGTIGDSAVFLCSGSGIPRPDISLSIDGTPVTDVPANPRRSVSGTISGNHSSVSLTYVNLTNTDSQVIQCNVSNRHGYIFTNAYLSVHSISGCTRMSGFAGITSYIGAMILTVWFLTVK